MRPTSVSNNATQLDLKIIDVDAVDQEFEEQVE